MKRIGLLTDHWGPSLVRDALENIGKEDGYRFDNIEDFKNVESVGQSVWRLLNLVDVVVACITKDSRNIYYEIGLAHGLGKPVVVLVEGIVSLPWDLIGQRVLYIESDKFSLENLIFRIKEAVDEAGRDQRTFTGYRGPQEILDTFPPSDFDMSSVADFKSLLSLQGFARAHRFEQWFSAIAGAVPGWEVVESESHRGRDQGFDLVVWNSRDDFELNALGNPIAVELKSIAAVNSTRLRKSLQRARESGLKAVVLATTGINERRTQGLLFRLQREEGINVIALDRDDLIEINQPEDLPKLFKLKVRELLYGGDF